MHDLMGNCELGWVVIGGDECKADDVGKFINRNLHFGEHMYWFEEGGPRYNHSGIKSHSEVWVLILELDPLRPAGIAFV